MYTGVHVAGEEGVWVCEEGGWGSGLPSPRKGRCGSLSMLWNDLAGLRRHAAVIARLKPVSIGVISE